MVGALLVLPTLTVLGALPPNRVATSRSGQFMVIGDKASNDRGPLVTLHSPASANAVIDLTPQTLVVSCERVKTEILRDLDLPDRWRAYGDRTGRILIGIDATVRTNEPSVVAASKFEEGWRFEIALPPSLTEDRLVRVLTEAILTELGSRATNERPGEPPLWLVEGLTQELLADHPGGLVPRPQSRLVADLRFGERLGRVRSRLSQGAPLGFHDLCQPDLSRMDMPDWELYSACSYLLVRELARLPQGTPRLANWIVNLQRHWNWQSGFLESFDPIFRSLLDVEKWWAVTLANFTGRTPAQTWPAEFALRKISEALQPVGILPSAGGRADPLDLEVIISDWDFTRQLPVLERVLQQARIIAFNAPPEIRALALRYADAIEEYLQDRQRSGYAPVGRGRITATANGVERAAIGRLRELEGERRRLETDLGKAAAHPTPASPASPR